MELTEKNIYKDIKEIKETIESSKRNFSGPYKLFFCYGILKAILLVLNLAGRIILETDNRNIYDSFIIEMVGAILIAIIYLRIYRDEKNTSNKYYLVTLSTWGIIAITIPFQLFIARLAVLFWNKGSAIESLYVLANFEMMVNILLVSVAMIMVGYITDKKGLLILSIVVLLLFIVIRVLPVIGFSITVRNNMEVEITLPTVFYYGVNIWGYIYLGFMLLCREKKSGNF